jgi:hypothetical protein
VTLYRFLLFYQGITIAPVNDIHIFSRREAMNVYQANTRPSQENQAAREQARARRMRRRHQNHSYFDNTPSAPSLFTLRW